MNLKTEEGITAAQDEVLSCSDLSAFYGEVPCLTNMNLTLGPQAAVGILGPNGAGKTSLLMALSGFIRTKGTITLEGEDVQHRSAAWRRRNGIGLVPQESAVLGGLTILDNLRLAWTTGTKAKKYDECLEEALDMFPALRDRTHQFAGNLSGGQRQMLAVSRGLMSQPKVMLLDEPSAGLSPALVDDLVEGLVRMRAHGQSFLLVEQNLSAAQRACDTLHILRAGRFRWSGESSELDRETAGRLYTGASD